MKRQVALRNHQREIYFFRLRLVLSLGFVLLMLLILLGRFFYLQVVRQSYFHTMAENNRIALVPIIPNRGQILDRNGVVLARNYSGYTLEIAPNRVANVEATIDELSKVVEISPKDRKLFNKLLAESHDLISLPIRSRLSDEETARFAAQQYRFPGVEIKARLFREYPFRAAASHLIGYIGRINDEDMQNLEDNDLDANYRGSDYIGKGGIEQSYEKELHGTTGFEQVEVDANGHGVRELARTAPVSGYNLVLTLDAKLQDVAEQAFGTYRGALVAIDPNNGEILAFVSKPGYDPNLFIDGIDTDTWDELSNSPDVPLNNRILRGQYPPGSTIKPFMALAGLHYGVRTPEHKISDPGYFMLPGNSHHYRDWKSGGHGSVDLFKSIVVSCDTYYYGLATELGIDRIHSFLSQFGFGSKSGIDMDGELGGLLPSQEWKQTRYKQKWFGGDTVSAGIGQGYLLVTPLQLAYATAILANDGVAYRPHLLRELQHNGQSAQPVQPPHPAFDMHLDPDDADLVKRAMEAVTKPGGTAAVAGYGATYSMAGKTGTAQVIAIKQNERYIASQVEERKRDHAWFIAFAPADHPRIALAVLVENGGHGGVTAAPIARKVFDYYLLGNESNPLAVQPEEKEPEHD
jgi:penicillin-binding protein 2